MILCYNDFLRDRIVVRYRNKIDERNKNVKGGERNRQKA